MSNVLTLSKKVDGLGWRTRRQQKWSTPLAAVKWTAAFGLLLAGGLWTRATPAGVVVRFAVDAGAIAVLAAALIRGRLALAAASASVVVLYNPLAPVFGLAGGWQRAALVLFAIPSFALLIWREVNVPRAAAVAVVTRRNLWNHT